MASLLLRCTVGAVVAVVAASAAGAVIAAVVLMLFFVSYPLVFCVVAVGLLFVAICHLGICWSAVGCCC